MKRPFSALLAILLVTALGAAKARPDEKPLEVFVSILPQQFFVESIGGKLVDAHVMVKAGQDPHTFEPMPRDVVALEKSKLYFEIKLPFEGPLLARIKAGHPNLIIVDTARGIAGSETAAAHAEHEGEGPGEYDPHIWLSPALIKIQARNIAEALQKADSAHAGQYKANLEAFLKKLDATDERIKQMLAPFKGRSFFVFHPAFGRFAEAYGLKQEAVEVEGKTPAPRQLAEMIRKARADKAKVVFIQPQFDPRSARAIAEAIGGQVAPLDDLAKDVLKNLEDIAQKIRSSMEK